MVISRQYLALSVPLPGSRFNFYSLVSFLSIGISPADTLNQINKLITHSFIQSRTEPKLPRAVSYFY